MRVATILFATSLIACRPPPDAPADLESLCGYLYEHVANEDVEYLDVGLVNLEAWLSAHREESLDGYSIYNLSEEAVDNLDGTDRSVEGLIGVMVLTEADHSVNAMTDAMLTASFDDISPGTYEVYQRTWEDDLDCFLSRECDWLEGHTYSESKWAGLIEMKVDNELQFRWVETDKGWMLVQRNWLTHEVEGDRFDLVLHDMYVLSIFLPDGNSNSLRMQAVWFDVDYGDLPVTEDGARYLIVNSLADTADDLDAYLDDQ